ncbi:MAG TPA: glycosyltransferase family A protein [Chthoniobacterales bacterium]
MTKPISLLIPCYNSARFLPGLFDQIHRQTVPFAEIIVYDDHSADGSAAVAEALGARVLRGKATRGPGFARNRLLEAAGKPFLHYHDADDGVEPLFVEKMSRALDSDRHGTVCALRIVHLDHAEADYVLRFPEIAAHADLVGFMIRTFIHFDAMVVPRRLLVEAGGFVDQMRFSEDRDLLARLAATGIAFNYVDEPLATWTKHGASLTRSRPTLAQAPYRRWYLHRCYRKLPSQHRPAIGDMALYVAWMFYHDARGREARAYREEARRWMYLARLCRRRYGRSASWPEKLLAQGFGPEVAFFVRRMHAAARGRLDGSPRKIQSPTARP